VVLGTAAAVQTHGTCAKEERKAASMHITTANVADGPDDCCEDECAWTPPAPCECCGCALSACLCCDSPMEICNSTEYQGEPTYACVVDMTTEKLGSCKQECDNGDWTAALGVVGAFYAQRAPDCHGDQCAMASFASGHDCCNSNVTCKGDCNVAITWTDFTTMFKKGIPSHDFQTVDQPLAATDLSQPIEKRQPVIAVIEPSREQARLGAGLRTIVIAGYHGYLWEGGQIAFEFLVIDSAADAPAWIGYDDLVSYQGGNWAYTAY